MARFHNELFEVLLDEGTMTAFNGDAVPWCADTADQSYRCDGAGPTILPRGELSMKRGLLNETDDIVANYPITSMYYAMAHRRENVEGVPAALMRVQISEKGLMRAVLDESLISHPAQHTFAFKKSLRPTNYEGLESLVVHPISHGGEKLLEYGYALLKKEILIARLNTSE